MWKPLGIRRQKQLLPPFVTFPWLEEKIHKFRCSDYENDMNYAIIVPFQHERTNVDSICYFGSLIRFPHFIIMIGEALPHLPPLTARHWFFIVQNFEQLGLPWKTNFALNIFTAWKYFYLSGFLSKLRLPWKQSLPWIFQAGRVAAPTAPRLVRHCLQVC